MNTDAAELNRRREAVAALGSGLRRLTEPAVRSTAGPETLRRLADEAEKLAADLEAAGQRPLGAIPDLDDFRIGQRTFSPVTGAGHPSAPPVILERNENRVRGRFTLGFAHEDPPRFSLGGVSRDDPRRAHGLDRSHHRQPARGRLNQSPEQGA